MGSPQRASGSCCAGGSAGRCQAALTHIVISHGRPCLLTCQGQGCVCLMSRSPRQTPRARRRARLTAAAGACVRSRAQPAARALQAAVTLTASQRRPSSRWSSWRRPAPRRCPTWGRWACPRPARAAWSGTATRARLRCRRTSSRRAPRARGAPPRQRGRQQSAALQGCWAAAQACVLTCCHLLQLADTAARPAHALAHVYQAGWLRPAVPAQFVAGNLTSVERSLPHPGAGVARPLRVWGTPNRCAPAGPPTLNPRRRAPAGCRVGIFGVH